jgi:hypothetical protein
MAWTKKKARHLREYRARQRFDVTPEPAGRAQPLERLEDSSYDVVTKRPESVVSGREVGELHAGV